MEIRRWKDVAMFIMGVWLVVSPFVLSFESPTGIAALNSYVLGAAVTLFAALALARPRLWEEQVNMLLGIWLIISPYVLGFQTEAAAMANHFILGVLVVGDALWAVQPYFTHKAT